MADAVIRFRLTSAGRNTPLQEFKATAQGLDAMTASVSRANNANASLARSLGLSEKGARAFAASVGLSVRDLDRVSRSMEQFSKAGVTSNRQFQILAKTVGLNRTQFDNISAQLAKGRKQLQGTAPAAANAGQAIGAMAKKYLLVTAAIAGLVAAAKPAYDLLIGQNEELQKQLNITGATIAQTNKLFVDGVQVEDPTAAITALQPALRENLQFIEDTATRITGVTSRELTRTFNALIQQGQLLKGTTGEIAGDLEATTEFAADFLQAFKVTGVPAIQLRSELRAILTGQRLLNSDVAKQLGLTKQQIDLYREQGNLIEKIQERLEPLSAAAGLNTDSLENSLSILQSEIQRFGREAGNDITETTKSALGGIVSFINENQDGLRAFSDGARVILNELFAAVGALVDGFADAAGPAFASLAESIDEDFLTLVRALILALGGLGRVVGTGLGVAAKIVSRALELLIGQLSLIGKILKPIVDGFEELNEILSDNERIALADAKAQEATEKALMASARAREARSKADRAGASDSKALVAAQEAEHDASVAAKEATKALTAAAKVKAAASREGKDATEAEALSIEAQSKNIDDLVGKLESLNRERKISQSLRSIEGLERDARIQSQLLKGIVDEREARLLGIAVKRQDAIASREAAESQLAELESLKAQALARDQNANVRSFEDQILAQEQAIAKAQLDITRSRVREQTAIEQERVRDVQDASRRIATIIRANEQLRQTELQRSLALGLTTQEEFNLKRIESTKARLQEELEASEKNIKKLSALQLSGQRDRTRDQQLDQAIVRNNALQLQLLQEAQRERELIENQQLQALQRNLGLANRETAISLDDRLALEQDYIDDLNRLRLTGERNRTRDTQATQAIRRRNELIQEGIRREGQAQQNLARQTQTDLSAQSQAQQQVNREQLNSLDDELMKRQELVGAIDQQNALIEAQTRLITAQQNLALQRGQASVRNLEEAISVSRELQSSELDPEIERLLRDRLEVLTGLRSANEEELLRNRLDAENQVAALQRQQFEAQIAAELEQVRIAGERLAIESEISRLAAERAQLEAQAATSSARARLTSSQANFDALTNQLALAQQELNTISQLAGVTDEQLRAAEKRVFDLQLQLQNQQQQLTAAEAEVGAAQRGEDIAERQLELVDREARKKQMIQELTEDTLSLDIEARKEALEREEAERRINSQLERRRSILREVEQEQEAAAEQRESRSDSGQDESRPRSRSGSGQDESRPRSRSQRDRPRRTGSSTRVLSTGSGAAIGSGNSIRTLQLPGGSAPTRERAPNGSTLGGRLERDRRSRNLRRLNQGGPVAANQPVMVGDGPGGAITPFTEVFIPKSAGTILNNNQVTNMLDQGQTVAAIQQLQGILSEQLATERSLTSLINQAVQRPQQVVNRSLTINGSDGAAGIRRNGARA